MAIRIGEQLVGNGHPCFVIAEIGVNHNGDRNLAAKMIEASAAAGADAVKFQCFNVSELILEDIGKAPYQKRTSEKSESQTDMLHRLAAGEDFHRDIMGICEKVGIPYLSTPYDESSLEFLVRAGVPAIKVASTDANNLLLLESIATAGLAVILSTGMTTLGEIQDAYACLRKGGVEHLAILKCTSAYPTQPADVHLRAMRTMMQIFDAPIGFSDHTPAVGAAPYAVALGACIIEKHVTLDRNLPGPDHAASITPAELEELVRTIRDVEKMLGSPSIGPTQVERNTRRALQRCLVTKSDLAAGTPLSRDVVTAKRTGGVGIPAAMWGQVVGRRLATAVGANRVIGWAALDDQIPSDGSGHPGGDDA